MGMFRKNRCLKERQVQAYIDNELDDKTFSNLKAHIDKCEYCKKKIETRKQQIDKVIRTIDILNDYGYTNKTKEISNSSIKNFNRYFIWGSVAASILIAILFYSQHTSNSTSISDDDCKWVALNNNEFNPDLESPNRLFRMRAIECIELNRDSTKNITYLVKTCKQ